MEAPRVQYARTADGVNIAYTVAGSGPTILYLQPYTHQALDWTEPELSAWYEALSTHYRVIRLDMRGFGFSEREVESSFEGIITDVDAVVAAAGLDRFDLVGISGLGFIAAGYAARRPELVRRLMIWGTPLQGESYLKVPRQRALQAVLHLDDDLATEIMVRILFGDSASVTPDRLDHAREAFDLDGLRSYTGWLYRFDATEIARQVTCPTLVVSPRRSEMMLGAETRRLAAEILGSDFVAIEAGNYPYLATDLDACLQLFDSFLSGDAEPTAAEVKMTSGVQTLLFTDLEASTPLTQRLGDEGAQEILRGHNATVRGALHEHGGREVKHTGDGIMASFPSAVAAVTAALQIQRELAGGEVRVRVGLNAGEPIAEDDDLFGLSVIKAARVADRAEPGQVLVSRVVMDLCEGKTFQFSSLGAVQLKGFDEAVELFEVAG